MPEGSLAKDWERALQIAYDKTLMRLIHTEKEEKPKRLWAKISCGIKKLALFAMLACLTGCAVEHYQPQQNHEPRWEEGGDGSYQRWVHYCGDDERGAVIKNGTGSPYIAWEIETIGSYATLDQAMHAVESRMPCKYKREDMPLSISPGQLTSDVLQKPGRNRP
jgi:hypothetical protein